MDTNRFMTFPTEDNVLFKVANMKEHKMINKLIVYSGLEFKFKI